MENGSCPEDEHRWCYTYSNQGGSSWFVLKNSKNADAAAKFLADTFGGSTELYDSLMKSNNIIGTYLPAADIEAVNTESEFFSGQRSIKHWSIGKLRFHL